MTVFVVQSTGNNVANLPPLLELASPEDPILWLESDRAELSAWSDGALEVLARRGLGRLQTVRAGTRLDELSQALRTAIRGQLESGSQQRICLVGNGGTKLQIMAAWETLKQEVRDPGDLELVYGLDRPAALQRLPSGPTGEVRETLYGSHQESSGAATISLTEVLECRGFELGPGGNAVRLWPGGQPPFPDLQGYGTDSSRTAARHDAFVDESPSGEPLPRHRVPAYDRVREHARFDAWTSTVFGLLRRVDSVLLESTKQGTPRPSGAQRAALIRVLQGAQDQGSSLYHATMNLAVEASSPSDGRRRPRSPIGPVFESAVVRRLLDWIDRDEQTASRAVSEVHLGVEVKQRGAGTVFAELDVLLVLRNGVLLHLECKSHVAPQKDLDARVSTLRSAGSDLAVLAVVAPLYTDFADRSWTTTSAELIERIRQQGGRIHAVAFTLPDQPDSYVDPTGASHQVPSFEQSLDALLRPYVPS